MTALFFTVIRFKLSPHIALIFTTAITGLLARFVGITWEDTLKGMVTSVSSTLAAVFLLMLVGLLIASWIQAGIVPTLIYYGFDIVSPKFFLVTSALISAVVSLATGSSWSTAGTIGLALMGLGKGLGVPAPMTAGAIISGAYFGDKMSPLSDTTNLAPAVAGSDLFTHIRHMAWTTGPSLVIALIIYLVIGLNHTGTTDANAIAAFTKPLKANFYISPVLLLAPAVVIGLVAFKKPALPSIFIGVVIGMLFAMVFQGASVKSVAAVAMGGFTSTTGNPAVDALLSRGGMAKMMDTVALIICAVSFGGAMEAAGFLQSITRALLTLVRGAGSLITVTILTAIGVNVMAGDQYIAIVLPGRMYRSTYKKLNLAPENLSRALEDSATLTSPLIPWNTCGAFMWTTLGVFPLAYLPYAFLNIINPFISILWGFTGFTIRSIPANTPKEPDLP